MKRWQSCLVPTGILPLFVLGVLWLAGCTTIESMANEPTVPPDSSSYVIPTPVGVFSGSYIPRPTPTIEALTQLAQQFEKPAVWVGPTSLLDATPTPSPRYTVRSSGGSNNEGYLLIVTDTVTGQEVHLGELPANASYKDRNDRYLIWGIGCRDCTLGPGLYAYEFATGAQIRISEQGSGSADPEIDVDWVLYQTVRKEPKADDPDAYTWVGTIHVHHLLTGEDVVLEENLHTWTPISGGYPIMPSDVYDIAVPLVAWEEADVISVYDLENRTTRTLDLPPVVTDRTVWVTAGDGVVVWRNVYGTWGYDLRANELFEVSMHVPGWERVAGALHDRPRVVDDQLFWSDSIDLEDGSTRRYYFVAPLLRDK